MHETLDSNELLWSKGFRSISITGMIPRWPGTLELVLSVKSMHVWVRPGKHFAAGHVVAGFVFKCCNILRKDSNL